MSAQLSDVFDFLTYTWSRECQTIGNQLYTVYLFEAALINKRKRPYNLSDNFPLSLKN